MAGKTGKGRFYGWVMVPILCVVYSIPIGFAVYGVPVINTFMSNDLQLQRWQTNLGYSIIGVVLGLGTLLIPWLLNRFGPKNTIAIGAGLTAVSSVFMALIGDISVSFFGQSYPVIYWLICCFVGLGVSFGSVVPVQALVLLWFNIHRALAMSLVLGGGAIGGFIYPQIISHFITVFGNDWKIGWYVIAIACFIGVLITMMGVKNRPEDLGQYPDGLSPQQLKEATKSSGRALIRTYRSPVNWATSDALRTRELWLITISIGALLFLWQVLLSQTPAHLLDRGFLADDPVFFLQPAFIYGLAVAFSIIGRLSLSFLGERIETRLIIATSGIMLVIGGLFFWLASPDNLWAALSFPVLAGIGFGAINVSIPLIVGNYFGVSSFPSLSRIVNPVYFICQYSGPSVAGLIHDSTQGYGLAVLIACIAGLISTGLIFSCKPPLPKQSGCTGHSHS